MLGEKAKEIVPRMLAKPKDGTLFIVGEKGDRLAVCNVKEETVKVFPKISI